VATTPPHIRLPRLVEGIDLRALPIGPAEAFVLSRVDGKASVLEIAEAAGLEPAAAQRIESHSNDAWALDDARHGQLVLRVSWRGGLFFSSRRSCTQPA